MNEKLGESGFVGEILLCEDNIMNQELVYERLARLRFKTIVAQNGKEGVEAVVSRVQNNLKPFDLIFMDILMPVMSGLEAAAEIDKLNTGTPIIAITASSVLAKEQYAAVGMSDCLGKPFTPNELLDCLKKFLKPRTLAFDFLEHRTLDEMSDDDKLRIKLIRCFMESKKNIYTEITKAIDDGDIKLAFRLLHNLKDSAGIFGKTRLRKTAENLESLMMGEEDSISKPTVNQPAMSVLKAELDAVIEEFEPLMDQETAPLREDGVTETKYELLSEEKTIALFEELEALLDGGDSSCLDLISSLRLIPGTDGLPSNAPLLQKLIHHIEYFEFEKAMETLVQFKNEWPGIGHRQNT
jgi:CheY-like chemotaxis protein